VEGGNKKMKVKKKNRQFTQRRKEVGGGGGVGEGKLGNQRQRKERGTQNRRMQKGEEVL